MSMLRKEIKACMSGLRVDEGGAIRAKFSFPKEFIGFKGHFPGNPVLPGVCEIQAALLMFEEIKNKNVRLKEIASAKFFAPVTNNQEINISLEEGQDKDSNIILKVRLTSDQNKVAELNLKVFFPD